MGEDEDEVIVGAVVVAVVETGGNAPGQATAKAEAEVEAESTDPCGVARAIRVPLEAGAGQVEAPPEMKGTATLHLSSNCFFYSYFRDHRLEHTQLARPAKGTEMTHSV